MSRKTRAIGVAGLCLTTAAALWTTEAAAQHRAVPRPHGRSVYVGARYYYPAFYGGFYWNWYGYGWYPMQPYPPYYWRGWAYDYSGAARLQVKPRNAEVYVDGHLVGIVDDFDGSLQRLHVAPGEHELTLYLEGYRTLRQNVLFRPGATLKITHVMEPLAPGEGTEPRPRPAEAAIPESPPPVREPVPVQRYRAEPPVGFGALAIRVQPFDATVLIDGEPWESPEGAGRLVVELSVGTHRVEVRKQGYRTYSTTVDVRPGATFTLNVSLTGGDGDLTAVAIR